MAVSITRLAYELRDHTAWQRTPMPLNDQDYINMVIYGLKRLYIDTARASDYDKIQFNTSDEDGEITCDIKLPIDEEAYVMLCAQINFMKKVASDVNNIVGYTTDALTVTNADKPYANIKDSIASLENERRITYYKMVRYTL